MKAVEGKYVVIGGEEYYEIRNYDAMQPFFISIASDTDLWMYLSSSGGLTCGRRSPDYALFPYYTDDKITQNYTFTGPRTLVRLHVGEKGATACGGVRGAEGMMVWEPFSVNNDALYTIERRILKSVTGNTIVFEERNKTLGLLFRYRWQPADRFGWVRTAEIVNEGSEACGFELIDGVQNVLPSGVNRQTQNVYSTLVDGYKKTEQVEIEGRQTPLVLYRMEAIMVDKAEPSESLKCNTVYSIGAADGMVLTSSMQIEAFRRGGAIEPEPESKGVQGAYMLYRTMCLQAGEKSEWLYVMDVEKDASDVRRLLHEIAQEGHRQVVEEALRNTTANLRAIVAHNDGVQQTGDAAQDARHFANVLFNTMRGGYYANDYMIDTRAFAGHVRLFNHALYEAYKGMLSSLPEQMDRSALEERIMDCMDYQLHRLFMEYLPLTFSRRHGDPSRPWNSFDIRVKDADGAPLIAYQGNWRDIFQNWEALSVSYPNYVRAIIAKFLNATTVDGYNPYRITSEGIDWEVINPDDPWSNIGYWGDHQIIYLSKLIELGMQYDAQGVVDMLSMRAYAYAAVPYRIKSYAEIVANPKNTIRFDNEAHERILAMIGAYGEDARLVQDGKGMPLLVTGAEKIMVALLAKMYNMIPGAGVWMNTLRPEWNDANNALVGNGASMVTVCYLHRYIKVLQSLFAQAGDARYAVHEELVELMVAMLSALRVMKDADGHITVNAVTVRRVVDLFGAAGEHYRNAAYAGFSGKQVEIDAQVIVEFLGVMEEMTAQSIRANLRDDGLYNAYNLVRFTKDGVEIETLYEMLEGQVAALSADLLTGAEAVALLDAMRQSALYRADQRSYMLYPARRRPSFLEVNNVDGAVKEWGCYASLLQAGILAEDCDGGVHFNATYHNASYVAKAVAQIGLAEQEREALIDLYERTFHHHAFTGRSGTFYKYEGLGSIYWHMVSKLLLAVGEVIKHEAHEKEGADTATMERLVAHYRAIKEGIGLHKSPEEYGSFPFDAYSHTPAMAGVQQPGMTGQVKEDILSRWFELGIEVRDGAIHIEPLLLRKEDFVEGELSFTYCGTSFVYRMADEGANGTVIPAETAAHIFARDGEVKRVEVNVRGRG